MTNNIIRSLHTTAQLSINALEAAGIASKHAVMSY